MTKQIFFILAVLCTLQAQASIQPVQVDTVQHTPYYNVSEELQPIQPVYLDGVVLPASLTGNWFVSIAGGTSAFLGTPLGCEDLFGRLKPSYSFAVGKWFTPSVGARINYSGVQFKDGTLSNQDYHHIHADLLWNVLGRRYARQEQVRWNLAPFAGVGLLHPSYPIGIGCAADSHDVLAFEVGDACALGRDERQRSGHLCGSRIGGGASVEQDSTGITAVQPGNSPEQRRFARTVAAD